MPPRALHLIMRQTPGDRMKSLALLLATLAGGFAHAQQPSATERNKAIVMRSENELWSRGDLAVAAVYAQPLPAG